MKAKDFIFLIRESFREWSEDNVSRLAAAIAYYTVFSLAPLLIIAIAVAGWAFGQAEVRIQLLDQIAGLVGPQSAGLIDEMIGEAMQPAESLIGGIIGVVVLIFGATGVFGELQGSLNTIWEVAPKPGRGIMATVRQRFLSFTVVLGIGFLLLVSLVINAALTALGDFVTGWLPFSVVLLHIVTNLISFGVITLLFALMFKVIPDAKVGWRDVWIGAAITALLFSLGKFAIGLYLGTSGVASAFGAAGSLVIILLWVYYSAQIFLLGGEFTQVYANHYGSRIVAAEHAIPLTESARLQQGIPHRETFDELAAQAERGFEAEPEQAEEPATETSAKYLQYGVLALAVLLILLRQSRSRTT